MARYKVGDRVVVRDDIVPEDGTEYYMEDREWGDAFVKGMESMLGRVVTIESIQHKYRIKEANFNWTDEMFVGLESEVFGCDNAAPVDDLL